MIAAHLRSLRQFSGTETRAQFWPWAGVVFAISIVPFIASMIPAIFGAAHKMQRFAQEHPDQVTVNSGPGHYEMQVHGYHPELMPDITLAVMGLGVSATLMVVFLGAAVARRLQDAGRSGFWGLMPLPFLLFGMTLMPRYFGGARPDLGMFGVLALNNLLYNVCLVALIVLLAQPTKRSMPSSSSRAPNTPNDGVK